MPTLKGKIQIFLLSTLVKTIFKLEGHVLKFKSINYPDEPQCIFALWHAHQCVLYGNKNRSKLHVLVSPSNDGEIISRATNAMGINTVRGSKGRKGVTSTMQLLEKLENGDSIAITVDGPKGPNHHVKKGIINISKLSQVPIVPILWYSNSPVFLKFNSWDEFRFPLGYCKTLALYGDPIYIPADADEKTIEECRSALENKMLDLYKNAEHNFKNYMKQKN